MKTQYCLRWHSLNFIDFPLSVLVGVFSILITIAVVGYDSFTYKNNGCSTLTQTCVMQANNFEGVSPDILISLIVYAVLYFSVLVVSQWLSRLTHWGRDKMAKGPINSIPAMVQIMAWRRPGDKPLSEPMVVSLATHICVARPQWVKPSPTEGTWQRNALDGRTRCTPNKIIKATQSGR